MAAPKWRGPLLRDAGSDPQTIEHLGRQLDLEVIGTGPQRQAADRTNRTSRATIAQLVGGAR